MPGRDGTGPMGQGPMTGGGFGYCPPENGRHFNNRPYPYLGGRRKFFARCGIERGLGRGFRNRFYAGGTCPSYENATETDEKQYLENELKYLEEAISSIKNRLNEFGSAATDTR